MLTVKIKWQGKCPNHPRFDPRKDGEAGIKGGCGTCHLLMDGLMFSKQLDEKLSNLSAKLAPKEGLKS